MEVTQYEKEVKIQVLITNNVVVPSDYPEYEDVDLKAIPAVSSHYFLPSEILHFEFLVYLINK